jgi:hypothetical protein
MQQHWQEQRVQQALATTGAAGVYVHTQALGPQVPLLEGTLQEQQGQQGQQARAQLLQVLGPQVTLWERALQKQQGRAQLLQALGPRAPCAKELCRSSRGSRVAHSCCRRLGHRCPCEKELERARLRDWACAEAAAAGFSCYCSCMCVLPYLGTGARTGGGPRLGMRNGSSSTYSRSYYFSCMHVRAPLQQGQQREALHSRV